MKNLFFAAAFLFASQVQPTAQTSIKARYATGENEISISTAIDQLETNAFQILLLFVVILSLFGIGAILLNCIKLKKQGKITRNTLLLILTAAALPFLGTGCSVEQMAQAERIYTIKAAEGGVCVCYNGRFNRPNYGTPWPNVPYAHTHYAQNPGTPYCKQCGLSIYPSGK